MSNCPVSVHIGQSVVSQPGDTQASPDFLLTYPVFTLAHYLAHNHNDVISVVHAQFSNSLGTPTHLRSLVFIIECDGCQQLVGFLLLTEHLTKFVFVDNN